MLEIKKSFITVSPDFVFYACKRLLNHEEKKMQMLQEPYIQKKMKGGWFKKSLTREQVITQNQGKILHGFGLLEISLRDNIKRAQSLMALAKIAQNQKQSVCIVSSDADLLKNFLL